MQKNLPKYTPDWVERLPLWAEASKRTVTYALCNDRRTLLWFANQRAVEYHPTLGLADRLDRATHLVLDLDPPEGDGFPAAVRAAHLVRRALADVGLVGAVKTSGAKGVHVFVPIERRLDMEDAAAATRAIARRAEQLDPAIATTAFVKADRGGKVFVDATRTGGATVVAAYSPRARPGVPVSFPVDVGRARRRPARRLHDPHGARPARRRRSVGRARCPSRSGSPPTSSPRATRSPSPASPRCTRASAASGRPSAPSEHPPVPWNARATG